MFDFDVLDRLEQGLKDSSSDVCQSEPAISDEAIVTARADHLIQLSTRLQKRSQLATIKGLHG